MPMQATPDHGPGCVPVVVVAREAFDHVNLLQTDSLPQQVLRRAPNCLPVGAAIVNQRPVNIKEDCVSSQALHMTPRARSTPDPTAPASRWRCAAPQPAHGKCV